MIADNIVIYERGGIYAATTGRKYAVMLSACHQPFNRPVCDLYGRINGMRAIAIIRPRSLYDDGVGDLLRSVKKDLLIFNQQNQNT